MIQGITTIIFDLGGVILDIDYNATVKAFEALGLKNFQTEFSQALQSSFFEDFEKGKLSEAEFYQYIQSIAATPLSNEVIEKAWNAMLLRIPLRRLQILEQLRLHYNTILLSNTNVIHERAFNKMLKDLVGFQNFGVFFDKVYLSHHVGMRKPDAVIFETILKDLQLQAATTLFIDDSPQHIATAQSLGIQTILLSPPMTIEKDIFKPKNQD